jgi:hypothetical protein
MTELVIVLGVFIWACLVLAAFVCCVVGGNADAVDELGEKRTRGARNETLTRRNRRVRP